MKETYRTTNHRRIYKYSRFRLLKLSNCPLCSPNKGCDRKGRVFVCHLSHSWKDQSKRKKQWKP
jgi:hypothetical protein